MYMIARHFKNIALFPYFLNTFIVFMCRKTCSLNIIVQKTVLPAILILLLSFLSGTDCWAQKIENHLSALAAYKKNDTTLIKLLLNAAAYYKDINPDSTVFYAAKGLELADELHYEKGIANSKHILALVYLRKSKYDTALSYYNTALHIYEKIDDKRSVCQVLRSIADIYYRQEKFDLCIQYYNKSISISKQIGDYTSQGLSYINIGGIYYDQGNYTDAISYYLEALKAFEDSKSNQDISMTLVNIATVYSAMGNNKKAVEYIDKSLAIKNVTNMEVLFSNYVNSGVVYGQMNDYASAFAVFKKALVMADSIGDLTWKNICLQNIADIYYRTGNYDTAYTIYKEVLKQNDEIKDTTVIALAKGVIGSILIKRGKLDEGIKELSAALQMSQDKNLKETGFETARDLSDAYEKKGDYKKSLQYHKVYYNYYDSIYNEKTNKRIAQLQFDYELGKKESQINLLNKDKEIQQNRNARQTLVVGALISGLLLLLIICMQLYRYSQLEKRNKEKILLQKEEIQKQALRLEELNSFKDKTFSVLSHDLRGPLGSVTATIRMLDQNLLTPEEFSEMQPEVNRQLKSLNILLDNLLQWAKNYIQGHTSAYPEKVELQNATAYSIELLEETVVSKGIKIINNIPASIHVLFDPEQLQIICRNIIMNALKFTPRGGTVNLNAVATGDKVNFSIADTGVGMSKEQVNKLFTSAIENNTYGTDGERGTGLGLLLCYEFIKANKGSISVSSELGKGTTFNLELPRA